MAILRAVAIFCEDLREEKSGQDILIGIMSDNIALPSVPAMLSKLAVYVRVYMDVTSKPTSITGWIQLPWDQRFELGDASADLMEGAFKEARVQKNPLAGIILKGIFSPLPIPRTGVIQAFIRLGDKEHLCGALNLVVAPNLFPTASQQPA